MIRVYLDNCCFNRPYDDQSPLKIWLETQAKLHVQSMVYNRQIELAWSFMLTFENSKNLMCSKKTAISEWKLLSSIVVDSSDSIRQMAREIISTGIKAADAAHVACAIAGSCDYFLTVDKRLLRYKDPRIIICNPVDFITNFEI